MLERFGISDRDRRNLVAVAVVIAILMAFFTDGSVVVRLLAGVIGGLISAVVFVVTTILIKKAGLEY
ncbi:hypothetical protein [Halapricum salinum]|uniref:Major facilitator superfamily (MFS) profile domain-containing protein n=1 Tax=Halapricum salinum TaxID=1457250 RepID=A0A4D6HGG8_9EURY|nr:hypothetical protein [Halapricum salinum]QCC52741.1 hypothetical protein DV733_16530 [Halapricum salinum]